jgi:hypothetical protein
VSEAAEPKQWQTTQLFREPDPDNNTIKVALWRDYDALRAELEAARKDAERYRWLIALPARFDVVYKDSLKLWEAVGTLRRSESFKAAIDAAMKEPKP